MIRRARRRFLVAGTGDVLAAKPRSRHHLRSRLSFTEKGMPMPSERNVGNRIGYFLLFILLSIVTIGLYPIYFWVSRIDETNRLLDDILVELRRAP